MVRFRAPLAFNHQCSPVHQNAAAPPPVSTSEALDVTFQWACAHLPAFLRSAPDHVIVTTAVHRDTPAGVSHAEFFAFQLNRNRTVWRPTAV